jgi:hypothetical protein
LTTAARGRPAIVVQLFNVTSAGEPMNAYIIRARTERKSAPLQFSFAISIAVFDSPEEAVSAARVAFPDWSEFTVIGRAPESVIERRHLSAGKIERIAWRA